MLDYFEFVHLEFLLFHFFLFHLLRHRLRQRFILQYFQLRSAISIMRLAFTCSSLVGKRALIAFFSSLLRIPICPLHILKRLQSLIRRRQLFLHQLLLLSERRRHLLLRSTLRLLLHLQLLYQAPSWIRRSIDSSNICLGYALYQHLLTCCPQRTFAFHWRLVHLIDLILGLLKKVLLLISRRYLDLW